MSNASYNRIGHEYLLSRPYVYNGGLAAQVLSNFIVTDTFTNLNISLNSSISVASYITSFFFNSKFQVPYFVNSTMLYTSASLTNLPTSVFGISYVALTFLGGFLASVLWSVWRVSKCLFLRDACYNKLQQANCSLSNQLRKFHFLTRRERERRRKYFLNHEIILCLICHFLFLLFIVTLVFSVLSLMELHQQLMSSTVNSSFPQAWQQSLSQLEIFFREMTTQSLDIFNDSLNKMGVSLKNTLIGALRNMTSDLLSTVGVNNIFNSANNLIVNLQDMTKSMEFIQDNTNGTLAALNYQAGFLRTTVELLRTSISQACSSTPQSPACLKYLNDSSSLRSVINTSLISDHSSITMLFILGQFQINISSIAIQFSAMQIMFNDQITAQSDQSVQDLHLDELVNKFRSIWPYISQTISPLKQNFASISTSMTNYLNIYGLGGFIALSILIIIVTVMIVISFIALLKYTLLYCIRKRIFLDENVSAKNLKKHQILEKLRKQARMNNLLIYIYFIVFFMLLTMIAILSLGFVNTAHLLYNEICVQIWRPDGLFVTDTFLDMFLNYHWSSIISFIISKDLPIQFTLSQPTKVLSGIRNNCSNESGIFYALNITNLVNISSFLWSPLNYQTLVGGLNVTYRTLINTNVSAMIPIDITSSLNSASSISTYFDKISYQPTIEELSKGVIQMSNYSAWISSASLYFSSMNNTDSNEAIRLLRTLNADVNKLQDLETAVTGLRNNFQIIQNRRSMSVDIQMLLSSISTVQATIVDSPHFFSMVQRVYIQRMLKEFPTNAEISIRSIFTNLMNHLFPCVGLSLAISGMLDNLCVNYGTLEKTCSYGLHMAISCGCLIVMTQVLWKVVRKDLNCEEKENISDC